MSESHLEYELKKLHSDIASCRICQLESGLDIRPARQMFRGIGSEIMFVGIEPGNTELTSGEAFSGPAGKRLFKWLQQAGLGAERSEVFARAYFTSLLKCKRGNEKDLNKCYKNCQVFMRKQLTLIRPKLFVTLGSEPLKYLFGFKEKLSPHIGNSYTENELRGCNNNAPFLLSTNILPPTTEIIPLPHPSPGSRWLNNVENQEKLNNALAKIKGFL